MKDIADTAAEWFDVVSGVVHQWFEWRDNKVPIDELVAAIDGLIRVHPAYKQTLGNDGGRREQARSVKQQ